MTNKQRIHRLACALARLRHPAPYRWVKRLLQQRYWELEDPEDPGARAGWWLAWQAVPDEPHCTEWWFLGTVSPDGRAFSVSDDGNEENQTILEKVP